MARLRDGVSLEQAAADLDAAMRDIGAQHPISAGRRVTPLPLAESVIADARGGLLLLLGAIGCLLLLACTNIAGLFITRGLAQQRDIAVRLALGGGRAGIVGRLVMEGVILAVIGGALGFVVTASLIAVVVQLMPDTVPRLTEVVADGRVALFTAVIASAAGVLCSLAPALHLVASAPGTLGEARSAGGAGRARASLIVAQLALTVVLLAGAGLLITSLIRLAAVDTGVTAPQVVIADVPLPTGRYAEEDVRERFFDRLLASLAANGLPGAALIFPRPMADAVSGTEYEIEDQPIVAEGERPHTTISVVSPGTFSALGMALVAGRGFEPRDREPAPPVVVVNSAFARLHWPDEDAVGKRLTFDARQSSAAPTWQTVVGVVGDTRLRRLDIAPEPTVYLSYHQLAIASTIVVRGATDAGAVAGRVRDALRDLDRDLALGEVTTFSAAKHASAATPRFRAAVIAAFGLVSLLVATIGVYGLLSATVNQRRREFGVRAAVGATPADVLRLVLGQGAQLVAAGMLLGLGFAAAGRRLVEGFLFGVSVSDVPTFAGALLLLGTTAVAACALPALRAARIDPSTALRSE
jgi:putative ABC transport system permease protein